MTRSVRLSEKAYEALLALKRPGEDFSDVILRVVGARKDPRLLLRLGGLRRGYDYRRLRAESGAIDSRRLGLRGRKTADRHPSGKTV